MINILQKINEKKYNYLINFILIILYYITHEAYRLISIKYVIEFKCNIYPNGKK
jgi:hypothetical protein